MTHASLEGGKNGTDEAALLAQEAERRGHACSRSLIPQPRERARAGATAYYSINNNNNNNNIINNNSNKNITIIVVIINTTIIILIVINYYLAYIYYINICFEIQNRLNYHYPKQQQ